MRPQLPTAGYVQQQQQQKTWKQTINLTYLVSVGCGRLAEGKGHETDWHDGSEVFRLDVEGWRKAGGRKRARDWLTWWFGTASKATLGRFLREGLELIRAVVSAEIPTWRELFFYLSCRRDATSNRNLPRRWRTWWGWTTRHRSSMPWRPCLSKCPLDWQHCQTTLMPEPSGPTAPLWRKCATRGTAVLAGCVYCIGFYHGLLTLLLMSC